MLQGQGSEHLWGGHYSLTMIIIQNTYQRRKTVYGIDTLNDKKFILFIWLWQVRSLGDSGGSDGKESACSVGDPGLIPVSGRSTGEGNGNALQYSCL